jgi:predicted component of type VI protein secretion system
MASTSSGGRGLSFSIGGLTPRGGRPPRSDDVLQVLVIADCSARAARGVCEPLAGRRAQRVDIERLEPLMRAWRARVLTPLVDASGEPFWFAPESLEDFHPDRLLESAAPLVELAQARAALDTEPRASARLSALLESTRTSTNVSEDVANTSAPTPTRAADAGSSESGTDMLARLLGGAPEPPPAPAPPRPAATRPAAGKIDLDGFIRAIVDNSGGASGPSAAGPSGSAPGSSPSVPRPSTQALGALASASEAELGRRLRSLLATPALRALEATWRGIDGLCRHDADEERLPLSVLDASFDELAADPGGLAALLDVAAPAVLLLDHVFAPAQAELHTLAVLLETCRDRELSLLAGAHPHLAGCAHFHELGRPEENAVELPAEAAAAWVEVLGARERGARLALALPRFLLRQPYGASGEPIEHFPFEEILAPDDHEAFSWGNGAYLLARALGSAHAGEHGVHPDGSIDVRGLPVVYLEGDALGAHESRIKPNAESWLSERSLGRLRAAGFSVLLGIRDTDRIRVFP